MPPYCNFPCLIFLVHQYVSDLSAVKWLDRGGKLARNTLLLFFRISTSCISLHIRLSFGIVHSFIIYSTISNITVRPREIGTGGTGVTSNHDNEANRGSGSVFYSLIWALQNEFCKASGPWRVSSNQRKSVDSSCARQRARSSTFIVSESLFPIRSHGEHYLKVPLRVLVESTSIGYFGWKGLRGFQGQPPTLPQVTHMQISAGFWKSQRSG